MSKKVLLTVDDGPSDNTMALVDHLMQREITAVMFFLGRCMEAYPHAVDYAIQRGTVIGNHSYSHAAFSQISYEQGIIEIERTEKLIVDAYKRNGVERQAKIFRFPYTDQGGNNFARFQEYLIHNQFEHLDTNFVNYEWFSNSATKNHIDIGVTFACWDWELWSSCHFKLADLRQNLRKNVEPSMGSFTEGASGEVLVIHDSNWRGEQGEFHFDIILEELERMNVQFVKPVPSRPTLSQMLETTV
ncbi:polysaccharide deacetylase family protein [Jeongeupia chitinilytica]|uniref:NodB homology domain-containing protein n=1 Tax=Jeongeupia chitinilytica TaxID=1041641 RepID=A0ABQ3H3D9_9NEIS|nr:polysaccharide deacetylase family protein [Jeongeupia chitinilytica]GHD68440.1 hypothetical protein GCM10007350_33700 [Jeongeupia chitinilytica]